VEECTYFWGVNTSWGINTAESKRPLNQEDNQAPQPTTKNEQYFLRGMKYCNNGMLKAREGPLDHVLFPGLNDKCECTKGMVEFLNKMVKYVCLHW
jgi:hypothetical protein